MLEKSCPKACFYLEKFAVRVVENETRLSSSANEAEEKGAMETNELGINPRRGSHDRLPCQVLYRRSAREQERPL